MKICIVGPSGAGKTTASKKLALEFHTTAYQFDKIYWDRTQEEYVKNSQEVINDLVREIKAKNEWIVEGAYDKRLIPFFKECSLIIRFKVPYWICAIRIVKRFLLSKLARTRPKETFYNTLELLRFAKQFDNRLDNFFDIHPEFVSKIVIVSDSCSCIDKIKKHLM
ncbi:AAA family ATPase [Xenorhabdus miraniensis]|uniref:ATPase AAA n=1 Tax=Xenorhabdus miraniensis TaxID=351674 RepID=A0A2D0JT60_9GAMM|nr:AAA family ATPase [Xenorhabdus miraniensis]PHM49487.1 ATPase AAA [Xenorhabdus miraniensis]